MKRFVSIILVILIIMIDISPVFAIPVHVYIDAINDSGDRPAPPPPADSTGGYQGGNSGGGTTTEHSTIETITHDINSYEYIKGNVKEDLGELYNTANNNADTAGQDSSRATLPIKDVTVRLLKDGLTYKTTYTNEYGNWEFNNLEEGTYSIEYYYGMLNGVSEDKLNNENAVKNILKYNGQDYLVSQVTNGGTYSQRNITDTYTQEVWEIKQSKNAVTQVMVALDCSPSMRNEKIDMGSGEQTKLAIAANATKKMISKLLDGTNNIYIGLVFFAGQNYRAVSLTKNEDELNRALTDIVNNGWNIANTDVASSLDKAMKSFVEGNDNKYIILVSDGFPTKAGDLQIYRQDTESEVESKLEQIMQRTRSKVREILENKIHLISLFTLPNKTSDDEETREMVRDIYGNFEDLNEYNDFNIIEDDGNKLDYTIDNTIKKHIEQEAESHEIEETEYEVAQGYEDYRRSDAIKENFKILNYKNTSLFKLIEDYNPSRDKENAKKLSNLTYGHVYGGNNYLIEYHEDSENNQITYMIDTDDDGENDTITKIEKWVVCHTGHTETMALAKKPSFLLGLDLETVGFQVKLQNGTQYANKQKDDNPDAILVETLDEKLAYGAEFVINYDVQIKNETKTPYTAIKIICYVPEGITLRKTKYGEYDIEEVSLDQIHNETLMAEEPYKEYKKQKAYILTLNESTGFNGTSDNYKFRIEASTMIKALDDIEDVICIGEIYEYSNVASRRMTQKQYKNGSKIETLKGLYPANNIKQNAEIDWDETEILSIMPPTGLTKQMIIKDRIIKITIIVLAILATIVGCMLIKTLRKEKTSKK